MMVTMKNTYLQKYLTLRRISQSEAARELGCSRQFVNSLIHGNTTASKKWALKIEQWSDGYVPATELIGLDAMRNSDAATMGAASSTQAEE